MNLNPGSQALQPSAANYRAILEYKTTFKFLVAMIVAFILGWVGMLFLYRLRI